MNVGELRRILAKARVSPSKRKGQSFLMSESVAQREVSEAGIGDGDMVLEIGPGTGILTAFLCETGAQVTAIELERGLAEHLRNTLCTRHSNLTIIQGDALEIELPPFDRIVSNVPYSISTPLLFRIMDHRFRAAVLLLQEEFALRLGAPPGLREYSRLSVMVQFRYDVEELFRVPRNCFHPRPDVDSLAVRLEPRPEEEVPEILDPEIFDSLVRSIFTARRKTMRNSIVAMNRMLDLPDGVVTGAMEDLDPEILDMRGEVLSPDEIADVANLVSEHLEDEGSQVAAGKGR